LAKCVCQSPAHSDTRVYKHLLALGYSSIRLSWLDERPLHPSSVSTHSNATPSEHSRTAAEPMSLAAPLKG